MKILLRNKKCLKTMKYRIWCSKIQQHCRGLMWRDYSAKRPRRCPINVTRTALICSFQFSILVQHQLGLNTALLCSFQCSFLIYYQLKMNPALLCSFKYSDPISIEDGQCRALLISIFNSHSISIKWSPLPVLIESYEHR